MNELQQNSNGTGEIRLSGTYLDESAAVHAGVLRPVLDKYQVEKADMMGALPPNRQLNTSCFYPDAHPTRVVQMNIDDQLVIDLRRQLRQQAMINFSFSEASFGAYFPLSTMFENSVLFVPSAKQFYDANQDIVREHFPEVETIIVNAFVVPAGKIPYGTHSASSIALQVPSLVKSGLGFPKLYKSFHTALVPSPLENQPFVIFEGAEVEAPNLQYVYESLLAHDLPGAEREQLDKALYLFTEGKLSENDLPTVRDFLMAKYWEKRYAGQKIEGIYCDSRVGDALYFDNYRAHADNTLPRSTQDRVTIDFRCFSKVEYPEGMSSGLDFIVDPKDRIYQIRRKRMGLEFLVMTLGYNSLNEFLQLIYGRSYKHISPFEIMTDLQFGVYNKSKYHLLDQDLDAHYERVEQLYQKIESDGEYVMPENARNLLETILKSERVGV